MTIAKLSSLLKQINADTSVILSIAHRLYRRNELEALMRWAKRKRLKNLERHYRFLYVDGEMWLSIQRIRTPFLYDIGIWVEMAIEKINFRGVHRKGSGANYRLRLSPRKLF